MSSIVAFAWPGPFEMILIAGLGLLLFGKRLPEVGRSVGKTIVEFKKGMRDVEKEMDDAANTPAAPVHPVHPKPAAGSQPFGTENSPGPTNPAA